MLTLDNELQRVGRFSGSAFGGMREGGYKRKTVLERIIEERFSGVLKRTPPSAAMLYGSQNEEKVLEAIKGSYKVEPNNAFYKVDFISKNGITCLVGATADALFEDGEPLEVKSPSTHENYLEQVKVAEMLVREPSLDLMQLPNEFSRMRFGKQILANFWQLAYQIWIMKKVSKNNLNSGVIVFSAPGNAVWKAFRPEFNEEVFTEIEEVIERAEIKIKEMQGGVVEKMSVTTAVRRIAEEKGLVNCIKDSASRFRKEIERKEKALIAEVSAETETLMEWLEQNVDDVHLAGDQRVEGLFRYESETAEITDWREVPEEFLKISLDKRAVRKYCEEKGEMPPGTAIMKSDAKVMVRAKEMKVINREHFEAIAKAPLGLLEEEL